MARLTPRCERPRSDVDCDPDLRDIAERHLEVAARYCLDICQRIIALEGARKPRDYRDAILRMGELGVLPPDFAIQLAPIASFRNILIHEYLLIDWDEVDQNLDDLQQFVAYIRAWLQQRNAVA